MTQYVALQKPPAVWVSASDPPESLPTCTVHETDKAPVATGLLTADGTPIYRIVPSAPMGFCR